MRALVRSQAKVRSLEALPAVEVVEGTSFAQFAKRNAAVFSGGVLW